MVDNKTTRFRFLLIFGLYYAIVCFYFSLYYIGMQSPEISTASEFSAKTKRKSELDTLSTVDSGLGESRLSLATISTQEWDTFSMGSSEISGSRLEGESLWDEVSEHNMLSLSSLIKGLH